MTSLVYVEEKRKTQSCIEDVGSVHGIPRCMLHNYEE